MKSLIILLTVLLFNTSYSNESWIRIYQPTGWHIQSFYKIHHTGNPNSIFIQHNTNSSLINPENGALKKYIRNSNAWTVPAGGSLNTPCAVCIDPPYMYTFCYPVPFFMIAPHDSSVIMKYAITLCANCPDASSLITYDNGSNWQSFYYIFGCGGTMIFPNGGDIDPSDESVWYYGYSNGYTNYQSAIFKSTNSGVNWSATAIIPNLRSTAPPGSFWGSPGGFIKVNPFNTNFVFTAHEDYMMLSIDGGYNFNSLNIPPLKELSFDYSSNTIYGVYQTKIYSSLNNGLTWDSSDVSFNLNTIEVSPDNSDIIYAGTTTGLYRSSNRGQNWNLYNNTFFPSKNVIGLSKDPASGDTIIVTTVDAVYKVFRGQLVGVSQNAFSIPSSFKLSQNFPNPFNPKTIINYELPKLSNNSIYNVKLTVYGILGNEVVTLVSQKQIAGNYSVEFDGSQYTSGTYFYRIESGDFVGVKKMILLK